MADRVKPNVPRVPGGTLQGNVLFEQKAYADATAEHLILAIYLNGPQGTDRTVAGNKLRNGQVKQGTRTPSVYATFFNRH